MAGKATKTPSYQLKVTLRGVRPPVWRRVVVPGHWHLGRVHQVLQVSMGWPDTHLHEFEVAGVRFGVPDDDWGDGQVRREATARLHEVVPDVGARMDYTYDFGDNWEHTVVVEALGEPAVRASCPAGRRARPPEDCGGPWGYAELLAAIGNPEHPEHQEFVEWVGGYFDPEAFDRASVDETLRRVR